MEREIQIPTLNLSRFYEAGYTHHLMYLTYHKISEQ